MSVFVDYVLFKKLVQFGDFLIQVLPLLNPFLEVGTLGFLHFPRKPMKHETAPLTLAPFHYVVV